MASLWCVNILNVACIPYPLYLSIGLVMAIVHIVVCIRLKIIGSSRVAYQAMCAGVVVWIVFWPLVLVPGVLFIACKTLPRTLGWVEDKPDEPPYKKKAMPKVKVISDLQELKNADNLECCICYEDIEFHGGSHINTRDSSDAGKKELLPIKTKCDHLFHYSCLRRWLRTSSSCPVCRVRQRIQHCMLLECRLEKQPKGDTSVPLAADASDVVERQPRNINVPWAADASDVVERQPQNISIPLAADASDVVERQPQNINVLRAADASDVELQEAKEDQTAQRCTVVTVEYVSERNTGLGSAILHI